MRGLEPISAALHAGAATIPARSDVLAATPAAGEPSGVANQPFDPVDFVLPLFLVLAAVTCLMTLWRRGVLARKLDPTPRRDVSSLEWPGWLAAGLVIYLTPGLVGAVVQSFVETQNAGADPLRLITFHLIGDVVAIAILIAMAIFMKGALARAGFVMNHKDLLRALGAFLLIYPIVWLTQFISHLAARAISLLTDSESPEQVAHDTLRLLVDSDKDIWWWGTIVTVTIGAPVIEEVVYRGFLQTAFVRVFGVSWMAILLTSAIFAGAHMTAAEPHALIGLFVLSVALGIAFERTGRLGVVIGVHAIFNIWNIIMALTWGDPGLASM